MRQKLLFINRYFHPDHSATSQMLADLAFGLADDGRFKVHVVTSRQRYDNPAANLPEWEEILGVSIHRVWTSRFGRDNLLGRAVDYASFYLSAAVALYRLADQDSILVAKTDPPLISIVACGIAKLRGATLINWIQDLFPEVAEALRIKLLNGPSCRFLGGLRNLALRTAKTNVVIGELMKQRLLGEGIAEAQIRVIHNWADETAIRPVGRGGNSLRRAWGLADRFVVGYSGNLGRGHEFDSLLAAAEALRARADIAFLIIGGGAGLPAVQRAVAERRLANFVFRPYQPREVLAESLSAADVHLVSLKPELEGLIVPSKFYGIAAAGRPVLYIGAAHGEIPRLLESAGCGHPVPAGDGAALRDRILQLADDPARSERMGRAARTLVEARYGKTAALGHWKEVLA